MPGLAFALDEDVAHLVASLLRSLGEDADSAKELDRLGLSDVQVVLRCVENGQTLVTHNSGDFRLLHEAWVTWRRRWTSEVERVTGSPAYLSRHAGILIILHLPSHDLARVLEEFAKAAGAMDDRLFMWSKARHWHELLS